MFPTKFVNNNTIPLNTHNAIHCLSDWTKKQVVDFIRKKGIKAFITPDSGAIGSSYNSPKYSDGRIAGSPTITTRASCCSFTKATNRWYFFPIHKNELENVGLVEDDLIAWIKFLNDMRVGFKYMYFGKQESIDKTATDWKSPDNTTPLKRIPDNTFYWVATSPHGGTNALIPYLHWISLRYLINSTYSSTMQDELRAGIRLAYFNIPRIAMYLHEFHKVPKLKAYLYAHVAHPFYSGYGLCYSDYMGQVPKGSTEDQARMYTIEYAAPCIHLTASKFRQIWAAGSGSNLMNRMLTQSNVAYLKKQGVAIDDLVGYNNPNPGYELFNKGDYEGFIKHVDNFYRKLKPKKNAKKETVEAVGANS